MGLLSIAVCAVEYLNIFNGVLYISHPDLSNYLWFHYT